MQACELAIQVAETGGDAGDLGAEASQLFRPFDGGAEEGVESVAPTIPLATARSWLTQRGAGEVSESSLVEVPLWRAGYTFGGASYQALVEGSTGRLLIDLNTVSWLRMTDPNLRRVAAAAFRDAVEVDVR